MTSDRRFEQDIPDLLAQLAPRVELPYRDDIIRVTASQRQRPAWTFPERWIPVDITRTRGYHRHRKLVAFAAIALVGLLIGAMLVAYVGSRPVRLPAPFGPAVNGVLYFASADGDIMMVDSLDSTPQPIVTGPEVDSIPLPSRDGQLLAFTRTIDRRTRIMVADKDGSDVRALDGTYTEFSEIDWSPTGDELAIISKVDGANALTILPTDGSPARTLDLGVFDLHGIWYLADGRIIFNGTTMESLAATYALYVADPSGLAPPQAIGPNAPYEEVLGAFPSPDGSRVVYHHWSDDDHGLHIRDIKTGIDTKLEILGGDPADAYQNAQFSPDGQSILVGHFSECCLTLSVLPADGGRLVNIGSLLVTNDLPKTYFAPDGKTVIAYYPSIGELWELDPTGKTKGRQVRLPLTEVPAYQRRAAP